MAKRVNTKFLIGLTVTLVVAGVAALGVRKFVDRPNAQKHIDAAKQYLAQGNYEEAWVEYSLASQLDRTNKEVRIEQGNVANHRTEELGYSALKMARDCWQNALDIDPHYKPALERLLDSYAEQMEMLPVSPQFLQELSDLAGRVLKEEPDNPRAKAYLQIAALSQWQRDGVMQPKAVQEAVSALADVWKANPADAEAFRHLMMAKIRLAIDARKNDTDAKAGAAVAEIKSLLDSATQSPKSNAAAYLWASEGYRYLSQLEADKDKSQADLASSDAALKRARDLAKPDDSRYVDIQIEASRWAAQHNDRAGAEQILRKLADNPISARDPRSRYELANFLGMTGESAKRDEAVRILSQLPVDSHDDGARGLLASFLREQSEYRLVELQIDQFNAATDPAQRQQLLAKADDGYKQLSAKAPRETVELLRLRAGVERAKGQRVQSVETLKRAVDMMEHMPNKPQYQYDLVFQLARALREQGQNRAAEDRLVQVLRAFNTFKPARLMLIELYLQEHNLPAAQQQIDQLAQQEPNAPEVLNARLALAQLQGDTQDAKTLYAKLPEDNLTARQFKAERAIALQDYPEAARLLEAVVKETPEDLRGIVLLTRTYMEQGQKDKAKALVDQSVARLPNDANLKLLQKQLDGASPEEIRKLAADLLASKAPTHRELETARTEAAQGNYDAALERLATIRKQQPDSIAAWDLTFQITVAKPSYDLAATAVTNLGRLDADQAGGRIYAWRLAMAKRDFPEAIRIARDLTNERSAFAQPWRLLGDALRASGQYNDALAQYRQALDIQSTNAEAYKGAALSLEAMGQADQARDMAEKGRQRIPGDPELREMVLNYDATTHAADVVPQRQQMLDANPNDPTRYYKLANTCMQAAAQAGDSARARQFTDQARQVLDKAVAKFPKNLGLNASLAEVLERDQQFDAGKKVLDDLAALPEYKDKPEMLLTMAEYQARGGHADEAEQYFRRAWEQSNHASDIELRLAQHLLDEKKADAALDVLNYSANASDARVARMRLQTLAATGHVDEAEKGIDQALKANPNSEDLLLLRLGMHVDARRFDAAREDARKLLALNPKSDPARYFQALIELRDPAGDLQVAVRNLADLTTRYPRNVSYKVSLADADLRRHEREAGTQQLEEAMKLDPVNAQVRGNLLQIYLEDRKWSLFDQVAGAAENDPRLRSNPAWPSAHALALAAQQKYPEAIQKIQQAIALDHGKNAIYHNQYLSVLLQAKQYADVLHETDNLIANGNKAWWVYAARGKARAGAGDATAASSEFDQALAAADAAKDFAGAREVLLELGSTLGYDQALQRVASRTSENRWRLVAVELREKKGDWAGVIQELSPLLEARSSLPPADHAVVEQQAALAYQMMGQLDKAKDAYVALLGVMPNNLVALNNVAYLLAEQMKNPVEAKGYSQRAYDANRRNGINDPGLADTHGWVLTLCGGSDADTGLNLLSSIVQDHPDFIEARYHLGMAYLRMKNATSAERQLATAMEQVKQAEDQHQKVDGRLKTNIEEGLKQAREQTGIKGSASTN